MDLSTRLMEAGSVARAEIQRLEVILESHTTVQSAREDELNAANAEIENLLEREKEDHVARVINGDDSCARKPKRLSRIANLRERIEAINLAMPTLKQRVKQTEREIAEARSAYARAIVPTLLHRRHELADDVRSKLAELRESLVELVSLDFVQDGTVGTQFPVRPEDPPVFSGRMVTEKLLTTIPTRLRPDALTPNEIVGTARTKARRIIEAIEGDVR